MAIVALITTGRADESAFADFLNAHFEDCNVVFRTEFTDGFTSARLLNHFDVAPSNAARLAARLVAAVDPGARRKDEPKADFAIAIEDIELINRDQANRITEVFANAVKAHVENTWSSGTRQDTAFARIKEKASFHLLSPMLESYFFTDPQSIESMNLDPEIVKQDSEDAEQFRTDQDKYLDSVSHLESPMIEWTAQEWFRSHPKHFINYHFDRPIEYDPNNNLYRETKHGADALRKLRMQSVFSDNRYCTFLRSLINDLSFALNFAPVPGVENELTKLGNGQTLRNI